MFSGTLALLFMLTVPAAGPADTKVLNYRDVAIPINVNPSRTDLREIILWVSEDRGSSWQEYARVKPDARAFNFHAAREGEYWFKVCVIDGNGKVEPENFQTAGPDTKYIIDDTKPDIRLQAALAGDLVTVNWDIHEENPDINSLRLDYRTSDMPASSSLPVHITPSLRGQQSFRVSAANTVMVRMQLRDTAGNIGEAVKEVSGTLLVGNNVPPIPVPINPPAPAYQPPPYQPPPMPPPAGGGGWSPMGPGPIPPTHTSMQPPYAPISAPSYSNVGAGGAQILASSQETNFTAQQAAVQPLMPASGGPLPPVQMVNNRQVNLEYTVANCGPSGVGSVELYMTLDDGRTWQQVPPEQIQPGNPPTPVPGDPGMGMGQDAKLTHERHSLSVILPGEAVYGFYLVAKSGVGLGRSPPHSGDLPKIRVEVDTTAPDVTLFAPVPDPSQHNALLMTWKTRDKNLAGKPISLEYAEDNKGTWKIIARDLPNVLAPGVNIPPNPDMRPTGSFSWVLPANIPAKVYLRVVARDNASNFGLAESKEVVNIDLNEPIVTSVSLSAPRP